MRLDQELQQLEMSAYRRIVERCIATIVSQIGRRPGIEQHLGDLGVVGGGGIAEGGAAAGIRDVGIDVLRQEGADVLCVVLAGCNHEVVVGAGVDRQSTAWGQERRERGEKDETSHGCNTSIAGSVRGRKCRSIQSSAAGMSWTRGPGSARGRRSNTTGRSA